jgi:hypothetical protein
VMFKDDCRFLGEKYGKKEQGAEGT